MIVLEGPAQAGTSQANFYRAHASACARFFFFPELSSTHPATGGVDVVSRNFRSATESNTKPIRPRSGLSMRLRNAPKDGIRLVDLRPRGVEAKCLRDVPLRAALSELAGGRRLSRTHPLRLGRI